MRRWRQQHISLHLLPTATSPPAGASACSTGPQAAACGGAAWFGGIGGGQQRALGMRTALHTLVGDYAQPEDLLLLKGTRWVGLGWAIGSRVFGAVLCRPLNIRLRFTSWPAPDSCFLPVV